MTLVAVATGCAKPDPAAQCGMGKAQKACLGTIYTGLSSKRERAEGSFGDQFAAKARDLAKGFETASPIELGAITAERFDPLTGNLDCRVEVKLKPAGAFATESVREHLAERLHK